LQKEWAASGVDGEALYAYPLEEPNIAKDLVKNAPPFWRES
jgi:hypothetical protein